jgi:pimeloyl-ACP methyl ester carboxylesterase
MKYSGRLFATLALALASVAAAAQVPPFPASFKSQDIAANGTTLHVRVGGKGPAVVLLHGFGETGDMWAPLAPASRRITPSSFPTCAAWGCRRIPNGGYDKATQGRDIAAVLAHLKIDKFALVTHDIGNMVGFALATQQPERVTRFACSTPPSPASGRGTRFSRTRCSGISGSAAPTWSGSSPDASASISTASGTNFRPIPRSSTRRRANIMRSSMPCPARCIRASHNSALSIRTRSTTAPGSRRASG